MIQRPVRSWRLLVAVAALLQLFCVRANAAHPKHVLVHLSRFNDNPHAVMMSLTLAQALQEQGAKVTLLLDVEGVRLADTKSELSWHEPGTAAKPENPALKQLAAVIKAGAHVLVCKHCAEAAHVSEATLRKGATLALPEQTARAVLEADQVVDY